LSQPADAAIDAQGLPHRQSRHKRIPAFEINHLAFNRENQQLRRSI
jgi:hypothetical protein